MLHRLLTLVVKELRTIMRDKQSRMIVVVPVIIQVMLFPFAATLEITDASIGIYSEDNGPHAIELTQRLAKARSFSQILLLHDTQAAHRAMNNQDILLLVRFPADFSRTIATGSDASVQIILDGRRSNGGQIAMSYVQSIVEQYGLELSGQVGGRMEVAADGLPGDSPQYFSGGKTGGLKAADGRLQSGSMRQGIEQLEFRSWYNPNLDYKWFVLPSLIALITTIGILILTALSVAREREQGTFEQLLVSPLTTWQIFLGKAIPAQIVAMLQGSIVLAAGIFFYRIPFSGSLLMFYGSMMFYGLSLIGIGLMISALCSTQQQAFIGVFVFMMPAIMLSGYVSPVENMPEWLQVVTLANPIRHFTEITKQIYLKDASFPIIWQSLWPLLIITCVTLQVAYSMFRRKVA